MGKKHLVSLGKINSYRSGMIQDNRIHTAKYFNLYLDKIYNSSNDVKIKQILKH